MDEDTSKEMLEHIRQKAERVSGKATTLEDVRQMCIENVVQRQANEIRDYLDKLSLEHIFHLIAVDTGE